MVAQGHGIHAARPDFLGDLKGEPGTAGGVLGIHHDEVQPLSFPIGGNEFRQGPPARPTYDVS